VRQRCAPPDRPPDGEDSAKIGLKVYEVEDLVDSLEAMQQKALEDRL
jgi:hypothetical protein